MKLVRNKIPEIIKANGKSCKYHVASDAEYKARLQAKLREEAEEFFKNPCHEEAADVYEVLCALCDIHELSMLQVEIAAIDKRKANGSFSDRIVLEAVREDADDNPWVGFEKIPGGF